jgi:stage V sporulation protein G
MAPRSFSAIASSLAVTQVQIFPIPGAEGKLRAFARILLNDELQLTSLRVYEGSKGLFVSYPNDPAHKGEDYRQLFYPVTRELRDAIEVAILDAYRAQVS